MNLYWNLLKVSFLKQLEELYCQKTRLKKIYCILVNKYRKAFIDKCKIYTFANKYGVNLYLLDKKIKSLIR
jgi:hypothetical protein